MTKKPDTRSAAITAQVLLWTKDTNDTTDYANIVVPLDPLTFAPPASPMPVSATEAAAWPPYPILPAGWGGAQHPSPRRQVAFCRSGRLRVVAGDGPRREFGAGAVRRIEDVSESGLATTVLGNDDMRLAIVQLPPPSGDLVKEIL